MTFEELGLSAPIVRAVDDQGYHTPSPVQEQAIPAVLTGKDVLAAAQTGTGKTASFTLPILERLKKGEKARSNSVRALILTPTRELAAQVQQNVYSYSKYLHFRSTAVFGGVKINPQMMRLRKGVDVLVATPGRLLDLFNQNTVKFKQVEMLVLDEADRMLDMGFIHDIKKILKLLPAKRQNLLFSATLSEEVTKLAKSFVRSPIEITIEPEKTTAESVEQWICPVDKKQKPDLLAQLIGLGNWQQVLVFSRTKHGADKLTRFLNSQNLRSESIHGNKSQGARTRALKNFKEGSTRVLVATDIAARGLDIDLLPHVINFDLPNVPEDYVHRIGRTGRAGSEGEAISLVCADEFKQLFAIEKLLTHPLERKYIEGFEPVRDIPTVESRRRKAKKPRHNSKPRDEKKPQNRRRKPRKKNASGERGRNEQKKRRNPRKKNPFNRKPKK